VDGAGVVEDEGGEDGGNVIRGQIEGGNPTAEATRNIELALAGCRLRPLNKLDAEADRPETPASAPNLALVLRLDKSDVPFEPGAQ
jgi:hypothetical protein